VTRRGPLLLLLITLALLPAPARAQERFEVAAEGFGFAVNVAFAPDGTMYVADKDRGEIRIARDGQILDRPFATLPVLVTVNETGLLGVALHPVFPDEPWVYAYFTGTDERNHLVRVRAEGDRGTDVEPLLDLLPATAGWHNGGDIAFGPDGMLYVSVGDAHDSGLAQDPDGLGGRILRLEPDGSVPVDNPFGSSNPTYALGIRNSFGLCFDPVTGELWETENGPEEWDEINLIRPGANYGWPLHLGPGGEPEFEPPVLAYARPIVLTGCAGTPGNAGLFFGEGYTGNLHRMQIPGSDAVDASPHDEIAARFEGGITDVAATPDGRIWVVTPNAVFRSTQILLPAPGPTFTDAPGATGPTGADVTGETAGAGETGATGPSASTAPVSDDAGGITTAGLVILAVLVGGLLLMRSRLLRR
jgi:quinoprotein glucose dehydrogenase